MKRFTLIGGSLIIAALMVFVFLLTANGLAQEITQPQQPDAAVYMTDDFESGAGKWVPQTGTLVNVIVDGSQVYSVTNRTGTSTARTIITETTVAGSTTWSDYSIKAKVKYSANSSNSAMILARYKDARNYYFLNLTGAGAVQLRRYYNGGSSGGTLGSVSSAIAPGSWYTIELQAKGRAFRVFLNGTQIITATETDLGKAFYTGTVGLGVVTASAWFDDIVITDLRTFTLTTATTGTGTGTITSNPGSINCGSGGSTCAVSYDANTLVTLTPTPDGSSTFAGWQGACTGTGTCQVTMDAAKSVTAVFSTAANPMLLVYKTGTGSGTVTSNPVGISCGTDCVEGFSASTIVTLTATADSNSGFTGWSGACNGTGICEVTMDQVRLVTATFTTYPLTITKPGNGNGTVTSNPAGISCGATCTANFAPNTVVTLTAVANSDSTFNGWSGEGCSGTGNCVVTMSQARSVAATFTILPHTLTVKQAGNGDGAVSSTPAGINACTDPTCSADFPHSTVITLTATAESLSNFTGWSGNGCSGTGNCKLTLNANATVTATFALKTFAVNVTKTGSGSGTVTSIPAGINCGITCTATYTARDMVTLTATADSGSTFLGWLGEGCTGAGPCVLSIDGAKSVAAVFSNTSNPSLLVYKMGDGNGTAASSPAGIDCGTTCTANFTNGQVVTLTATAVSGSKFMGWCGACAGNGPCVVTMNEGKSVSALFADTTNILLSEDFESGDDGWIATTGTWSVVDVGGNHVYSQTAKAGSTRSAIGSNTWSDYSITARVKVEGTYSMLMARYQDSSHYYFMALRGNGKIEFKKWDGSGSLPMGSVNAGIVPGQWYTATLKVVGTTLVGYLNGTARITVTDSTVTPPFITGLAGVGTLDGSAQFDDVIVTSLIPKYLLTVKQTGSGTGSVSSTPDGMDCDLNCLANLNAGTVVTLTATPDLGSTFAGWMGGGCSGTGACVVKLSKDTTVTAVFSSPDPFMLVVNKTGNGNGMIVSVPTGIACTEDCTVGFAPNAQVTLTATPDALSEFTGWSGAGCSGTGSCVITMDAAKNVAANFKILTYPLTIVKTGNNTGTISSLPAGISCGVTCTAQFLAESNITLMVVPAADVFFTWNGGGCSGSATSCQIRMDGPKIITATFNLYKTYLPLAFNDIKPVIVAPLYVSPTGLDTNPGTITEPLKTLPKAVSLIVPGQTVFLRGGTYELSDTITLTTKGNSANFLKIWAYTNEKPVLDFAKSPAGARGLTIMGNFWHIKGLEIKNAQDNAIKIEGSYNIIENCSLHDNQDTGLQIGLGSTSSNPGGWIAAFNQVINTDSYRNFDAATNGSNADGFAVKLFPGRGNTFFGCRAWENADDGWDLFETYYPVVIENSWTWHNGDPTLFGNPVGWGGNGNGFKLGGNYNHGAHIVKNCIAFDHRNGAAKGFDQNHGMSGITIYNSVAWNNGVNFSFPEAPNDGSKHVLQNNVAFAPGTQNISLATGTTNTHNSWNLAVTADAADFISLLVEFAKAPRLADGSLPVNDFARLVASSDLIDKGLDIGIPYLGLAPDLGAFELK
jgi:hypothetical protein